MLNKILVALIIQLMCLAQLWAQSGEEEASSPSNIHQLQEILDLNEALYEKVAKAAEEGNELLLFYHLKEVFATSGVDGACFEQKWEQAKLHAEGMKQGRERVALVDRFAGKIDRQEDVTQKKAELKRWEEYVENLKAEAMTCAKKSNEKWLNVLIDVLLAGVHGTEEKTEAKVDPFGTGEN